MNRKMKDSGIEWIGEIPEEWERARLKDYYRFEKGKNAALYTQEYLGANPGPYPVYSGQTENDGIMGLINTFDYEIDECLFTTTVGAKVMTPKIIKRRFSLSQNCLIMLRTTDCDNRFFYYSLYPLFEFERSLIPTYMQPSLRMSDLNRYQFFIPPIPEQQAIANFLDQKCSEIDHILEKTRESIEEYKKLKQSIITEAVTKGLDRNVEMKESGIEWIGEIPRHWEVLQAKYIVRWKSENNNPDAVVLSLYRDFGIVPKDSRDDNHNVTSLDTSGYKVVNTGDLVINKMKAWQGSLAVSDYEGIVSPAYHVAEFVNVKVNPKYFHHLMRNQVYLPEYRRLSTGMRIGQWDLSFDSFKNLNSIIPPKDEQLAIIEYIDNQSAIIDSLISQKQTLLTDLEAYKKSLIFECVTGKREVM